MIESHPLDIVKASMEKFAWTCRGHRLIYLSSDGIFDGQKGLYTEIDIPSSQTLYGRNLANCESIIADHCRDFCIIRPSYIYGYSNGKLDNRLSKTQETLKAGREVLLFDNMFKSPLGVKQIARAVIDLSRHEYIGIIHVAGQRMSVYEFHLEAMRTMRVDTRNLRSCKLPPDKGLLRDTSLDISLWQQLTASQPQSIQDALTVEKNAA